MRQISQTNMLAGMTGGLLGDERAQGEETFLCPVCFMDKVLWGRIESNFVSILHLSHCFSALDLVAAAIRRVPDGGV